ncbi:MAG TPA: hypothetical protein VKW09_06435 [bacterium]|nr:hypothetical protein [bacterium]
MNLIRRAIALSVAVLVVAAVEGPVLISEHDRSVQGFEVLNHETTQADSEQIKSERVADEQYKTERVADEQYKTERVADEQYKTERVADEQFKSERVA